MLQASYDRAYEMLPYLHDRLEILLESLNIIEEQNDPRMDFAIKSH